MRIPRWTAYPALALLAVFLITAIPSRKDDAAEGAARAAREHAARAELEPAGGATPSARARPVALPPSRFPRIVVLGIDGLDPEILADVVERYPERMPNFRRLIEEGSGILELGTSTPPQSPVAWSNFITGRNPGGHGIFDFIHRDPRVYAAAPATVTVGHADPIDLPGKWQFPIDEGGDSNRSGKAFWAILGEHGVPADVWRMPINFPVEGGRGLSFPGMMTPAVDSAYGEATLYTTDPPIEKTGEEKVIQVQVREGVAYTTLLGPVIPFHDPDPETLAAPRAKVPLKIYVDEESGGAAVDTGSDVIVLEPGEWSRFTPVSFDLLPLGAMSMSGIVRFYLRSITPELELYASPINIDPKHPFSPVASPADKSEWLAERLGGYYYTQGMPEDVGSLKKKLLDDEEFMRQAQLVFEERGAMLDLALRHFVEKEEGGLLFFYYSSVDLCCHMMWRHSDALHPYHDAELAARDSSWWSGRSGSKWLDVVDDLYLRMDPVLGRVREQVGDDALLIVMSDHGFAPYRRKFNLTTWLWTEGYLVLREGLDPREKTLNIAGAADWSKSRAYGIGFNGLYLNLAGREAQGIVKPGAEAEALLSEIETKLEAIEDADGTRVVLAADLASEVYSGERVAEAPDIQVGYNSGYGNSDEASQGFLPPEVLEDNLGGTFNGSHLMHPSVVQGVLLTNARVALEDPRLEDLTVELLKQYSVDADAAMDGRPVFE